MKMFATLTNGQQIGTYRIDEFLKISANEQAETYIARDNNGNKVVLKLFKQSAPPAKEADRDKVVSVEYSLCNSLQRNDTLAPFVTSGTIEIDGCQYNYLIRQYVDGARLSDIINAGMIYSWRDAATIMMQVLRGLQFLHNQEPAVLHNDLTADNIIIRQGEINKNKACIIGMGHLSYRVQGRPSFTTKDLNILYRAPETFIGLFDEQSDIFSLGVLLFKMLTGREPWAPEDANTSIDKKMLRDLREAGDVVVDALTEISETNKAILKRMLALDCNNRFRSVKEVTKALLGDAVKSQIREHPIHRGRRLSSMEERRANIGDATQKRTGGGFADVAGMADVKRMLYKDVMFVMQNKEKAMKYRLKSPNGALFYGPPGCGKTFIAEKFAEESHLNFMMIKASDLGSIYIHGTQGKIAELFDEAEKKAPTVICFDELDGMVPDRANIHNEGVSGEVNEFLSQLNNCSSRGIFVIGTSNRPEKIDQAVLRTGRIDKMVYIPMPDYAARRELFRIHLDGRFCDDSIDLDELARRSDGYVASDIEFVVNETALEAAMNEIPIGQQLLLDELGRMRKSVSTDDVIAYEQLYKQFDNGNNTTNRRRIGYVNK